jgi:hydrogenase small subunit
MKLFYGTTVHRACTNRDYLDDGIMAKKPGQVGCLLELGCKGPFTMADCPRRSWNSGVNWCIGSGGPCLGCTEPGFPDAFCPFLTLA